MATAIPVLRTCALLSIGLMASDAAAATRFAASASLLDVNAAVSTAAPGDVIQVPPGSAVWSGTLNVSKNITLQGAGIGQTVIRSSIADNYQFLISVSLTGSSQSQPFRITGFTFDGAWKSSGIFVVNNDASTSLRNVRIDHNRFTNLKSYATKTMGEVFGVIDSNDFVDNDLGTQVLGNNWYSWENHPLQPGTENYLYIESNTYSYTGAHMDLSFLVESGQGGRYVFRYNTMSESVPIGGVLEMADVHGNQEPVTSAYRPGGSRGSVGAEIYNNQFDLKSNHRIVHLRGGAAKIFNNTVNQNGGSGAWINLTEYDGWSYHFLSTYPGYDPVTNSFFWNNRQNGGDYEGEIVPGLGEPSDTLFIQLNRDFFRPSYGDDAARPSSCATNTYYGAVDTGTLYRCIATNIWTVIYAPYDYPHPLTRDGSARSPSSPQPQPPAPPKNVRIGG